MVCFEALPEDRVQWVPGLHGKEVNAPKFIES